MLMWAADLIDIQALSKDNKIIKYLLTVIDVFSKFVWIIPIKQKSGKEIAEALSKLWVDKGGEFYK